MNFRTLPMIKKKIIIQISKMEPKVITHQINIQENLVSKIYRNFFKKVIKKNKFFFLC